MTLLVRKLVQKSCYEAISATSRTLANYSFSLIPQKMIFGALSRLALKTPLFEDFWSKTDGETLDHQSPALSCEKVAEFMNEDGYPQGEQGNEDKADIV